MIKVKKTDGGKKRRPSCNVTMPTSNPKVNVHASWPQGVEENIRIRAYPVDEHGIRIPGITEITRTAKVQEEIILVLDALRECVLEKMYPKKKYEIKSKLQKGELDYETPAVKAFYRLEASGIKIGRWGESTTKKALQYFVRNSLSEIQYCTCDEDFGPEQRDALFQKYKEAALTHGNSKGNIAKAEAAASGHMADAGIIYGAMMSIDPNLPSLTLLAGVRRKPPQAEQIKMLPIIIHIRFRRIIEKTVATQPKLARAAALMDAGLRAGEAAGTLPADMHDAGAYIVVYVQAQEKGKKRNPILKSSSGYRPVVLDAWETEIVRRCTTEIEKNEIEDLTIASIEGKELSSWVKNALVEAGCDEEFMAIAHRDMLLNPEKDAEGNEVDDISAHVLRRHRATVMTTIMSYTRKEMEISLGHEIKITEAERQSFKTKEVQDRLSLKNCRYDIIPELSNSPRFFPYQAKQGKDIEIRPFPEMIIENNSSDPLRISLDVDAAVIGECISIDVEGNILESTKRSTYTVKDKHYQNSDVIGDPWRYMDIKDIAKGGKKE